MAGVCAQSVGRSELDTHANLGVVGKGCTVYEETGRTVDVKDFKDSSPTLTGLPIVNCIMAHDDVYTGETIMLLANDVMQVGGVDGK